MGNKKDKPAVVGGNDDLAQPNALAGVKDLLKECKKELFDSRERLNRVMAIKNEGIWDWNLKSNLTSFDDIYYSMAGYEPQGFPQDFNSWKERVHPDDQPLAESAINGYLSGQSEMFDVEFRFRRKDDSWMWIQGLGKIVEWDEKGNPVRMMGTHTDITRRRIAEDALRDSEKKHRQLFETMSSGVIYQDIEGHITSANPAAEKILGLNFENMRGRTSKDPRWRMISEEGACVPDLEHPAMIALATGKRVGPVIRGVYIPEKGQYIWIYITAIPVYQPEETKPSQVYAIFDDITQRKRDQDALKDGRKRMAGILQGTNAGTWEWNVQTGEIIYNERWAEIIGYTLEEISPVSTKTFEMFCNPDDLKAANIKLKRHFNREIDYYESESRMMHKDGHWVWVVDRGKVVTWSNDGEPLMMMGTHQDITEKKLAEEHIALLAQMVDIAPGAITVHDFNGNTFYANQRAFEMHGYTKEELMVLNLKDIETPESAELIKPRMKVVIDKGETSFEVMHRRKDGTTFPGHVHIKKIEWEGKPAILSITLDLTEKKEAEERHDKLQAQFNQAQKMESVGRLAGGVAHDFNNMLNVIMGHAELTLIQIKPEDPLHESIEEIMKAAKRSADLTRQLLAFARKQTISPRVIDLNSTIEGTLKMLRRIIGEDIELIWKPENNLWPVMIDPSQMDQILANLCVNARDAINSGGKIIIETDKVFFDEDYCIIHDGLPPGKYVLFSVSDNGCGMNQETMSHLFEPFFTTKKTGAGTGLGLATVYGAVKQNNGYINVYSEPSVGTTVRIYLPGIADKDMSEARENISEPVTGGNEVILLVEDEPAILRLTRRMLEGMGYTVISAGSPGEAISVARGYPGNIDLLITDVVMPEMNGRELAKNILSLYPDIKRLYMSGYTADVIAYHGVLDEGVHFIQKPFMIKDFAAKIREILLKKQ
ncbi:MAG: PAS domain S-box protein [Desulfatiglans sp.]|nr:PAS domain S-box protein [Desulfatiglans sp.]